MKLNVKAWGVHSRLSVKFVYYDKISDSLFLKPRNWYRCPGTILLGEL